MFQSVLVKGNVAHIRDWLVYKLITAYNDASMPGHVPEIEDVPPDDYHPQTTLWVDVTVPRGRRGTLHPMAMTVELLQIADGEVLLDLTAEPVAQPWFDRLVGDMHAELTIVRPAQPDQRRNGAPRLEKRVDWEFRVEVVQRIDQAIMGGKTVKAACQLENITPRTYHRWRGRILKKATN